MVHVRARPVTLTSCEGLVSICVSVLLFPSYLPMKVWVPAALTKTHMHARSDDVVFSMLQTHNAFIITPELRVRVAEYFLAEVIYTCRGVCHS